MFEQTYTYSRFKHFTQKSHTIQIQTKHCLVNFTWLQFGVNNIYVQAILFGVWSFSMHRYSDV